MATANTLASADNVVEFRPQRARPVQKLEDGLTGFLSEMNAQMTAVAGISYIKVRTSIHGDGFDTVRSYIDEGISPAEAVEDVVRLNHFIRVGDGVSPAAAAAFNKARAAIAEFCSAQPGWHYAPDGKIYSNHEDGVLLMSPVLKKSDGPNEPVAFAFGIVFCADTEYDLAEERLVGPAKVTEKYVGFDIHEPLDAFERFHPEKQKVEGFDF